MYSEFIPLWSEIRSILDSIYGKATTLISFFSPFVYLYFLPEGFLETAKVITGGALLVVASNIIFIVLIPVVQRHYTKYLDYEDKCLKLENEKSLDVYEEFGQVSGKAINISDWSRSGLSFAYLKEESVIPDIDDYKKNFSRGEEAEGEVNRKALVRSLAAIKYVSYDASNKAGRIVVSCLLILGIVLMYVPIFANLAAWVI